MELARAGDVFSASACAGTPRAVRYSVLQASRLACPLGFVLRPDGTCEACPAADCLVCGTW
jgi:hypothetical protein